MAPMLMRSVAFSLCVLAGVSSASGQETDSVQIAGIRPAAVPQEEEVLAIVEGVESQGSIQTAKESKDNCWVSAANRYGVDAWLLYSIAVQESSLNAKAFNRNKDGSYDTGLMQINSRHLKRLAAYGIKEEHLWDGCFNIHVGAWILADSIRQFGPNWNAVGAYNAGNKRTVEGDARRAVYANSVYRIYRRCVRLRESGD